MAKAEDGAATSYGYDAADQLTQDGSATFGYDATGNRAAAGYAVGVGNRISSDGVWTYTHDAEGNVVKKSQGSGSDTWVYGYDHRGQMVTAAFSPTDGGAATQRVTYAYDASGARIERAAWDGTSTAVERYALDGWDPAKPGAIGTEDFDVWADLDGGGALVSRYAWGPAFDGLVARQDAGGAVRYYLPDRQGSVRVVVDGSAAVLASSTFDAFGGVTAGSPADRFGYTGQEHDARTGLISLGNGRRELSPATGSLYQTDPGGFAASGPNLYAYVKNAPTNATDPSGHDSLTTGGGMLNWKVDSGIASGSYAWTIGRNIPGDPAFVEINVDGSWIRVRRRALSDYIRQYSLANQWAADAGHAVIAGELKKFAQGQQAYMGGSINSPKLPIVAHPNNPYSPERPSVATLTGQSPEEVAYDEYQQENGLANFGAAAAVITAPLWVPVAAPAVSSGVVWGTTTVAGAATFTVVGGAGIYYGNWSLSHPNDDYALNPVQANWAIAGGTTLLALGLGKILMPFWQAIPIPGPVATCFSTTVLSIQGTLAAASLWDASIQGNLSGAQVLQTIGPLIAGMIGGSSWINRPPRIPPRLSKQPAPRPDMPQLAGNNPIPAKSPLATTSPAPSIATPTPATPTPPVSSPTVAGGAVGGTAGVAVQQIVQGHQKSCFAAGTPLRTPAGWQTIESLGIGDWVLARDEHDPFGDLLPKLVEEVFVTEGLVWHLHAGGQVIRTTAEHPFYVREVGWVPCNQLKVGNWLVTADGWCVQVDDLFDTGEFETLYNIRVADFHTYFVGCDEWGVSVWAHNACAIVKQYRTVGAFGGNPRGVNHYSVEIVPDNGSAVISHAHGEQRKPGRVDYFVQGTLVQVGEDWVIRLDDDKTAQATIQYVKDRVGENGTYDRLYNSCAVYVWDVLTDANVRGLPSRPSTPVPGNKESTDEMRERAIALYRYLGTKTDHPYASGE